MPFTLEELKRILSTHLDTDQLLDKLQITAEDILDRFEDRLVYFRSEFEDYEDDFNTLVEYEREAHEPDPDDLENMNSMGFGGIYEGENFEN